MNTHKANMWLYNGTNEVMCFDEIPDLDGECRPKFKVNSLSCSLQCNFAYALIVYHLSWAIIPHKEPPKHHVPFSSLYMIFKITPPNKILSSVLYCLNYVFHHYIPSSTLRLTFLKLHSPHLGYEPFC